MREDNLAYFELRLAQEVKASAQAADAVSAAIHRELADHYRALAEAERLLAMSRHDPLIAIETVSELDRA